MTKFMENFLRLQNYFYGNNSSANSSCPSSPAKWCIDENDLCIQNPTILPLCLLALIIGLFCSKRISQLSGKFPSRWFYHLTFFLYGIMMTSAGILHCFIGDPKQLSNTLENTDDDSFQMMQLIVTIIDVGLTSSIAISFLFCGLCDIRVLNPQSMITHWLLVFSYFIIFLLWTFGLLNQWNWAYNVLYLGVVSISGTIYLLTQLCIKSSRRALPALFVGGIYAALGLLANSFGAEHICKSEGSFWSQYIGPEFIWFLFSDISVAFIFIYVIRANQEKKIIMKNEAINSEEYPEKY